MALANLSTAVVGTLSAGRHRYGIRFLELLSRQRHHKHAHKCSSRAQAAVQTMVRITRQSRSQTGCAQLVQAQSSCRRGSTMPLPCSCRVFARMAQSHSAVVILSQDPTYRPEAKSRALNARTPKTKDPQLTEAPNQAGEFHGHVAGAGVRRALCRHQGTLASLGATWGVF